MSKATENNFSSCEISGLWVNYQSESIHRCGLVYFLQHINDEDIKQLLEESLTVTNKRLNKMVVLFKTYDHLVPEGFSDLDINLEAPRLFSDTLYLYYLLQTIEFEMTIYDLSMRDAINEDLMHFYDTAIQDTLQIQLKTKKLAKQKGLYIPAPSIPKQAQIEFVKRDRFLSGWFGDKRPLLGIEITQLVQHSKRNALGQTVITAFSQVAKSKEVRRYFEKGREISGKHLDIFTSILHQEYLPNASLLLTSEVTDAKVAPFSDKLMTVFITNLITVSVGDYGLSTSMSPRRDLALMYTRLIGEILKYANEGAELLIKNGWLEQPPMAADRKDLAK